MCQDLGGWAGLGAEKDDISTSPKSPPNQGKPSDSYRESSGVQHKKGCCCNCTWLRHEKVIICCQGRQDVSVRQEPILTASRVLSPFLTYAVFLTCLLSRTRLKVDFLRKRETAEAGKQGKDTMCKIR